MTILIAGGSGYVGKNLSSLLTKQGYEVIVLSRSINSTNANTSHWNPEKEGIDMEAFLKSDVLINLSGHNINTSWNKKNKELIINSFCDEIYDAISMLIMCLLSFRKDN